MFVWTFNLNNLLDRNDRDVRIQELFHLIEANNELHTYVSIFVFTRKTVLATTDKMTIVMFNGPRVSQAI